MNFTNDDKQVIQAFMEQKEIKSHRCKTDGQSLFYGDLRIAEHVPDWKGKATTLVYDYTEKGQAFVDKHAQWLVYQLRSLTPRQNTVNIRDAVNSGLVEHFPRGKNYANPFSEAL